ncbi:Os10g0544950, partial [Oryza sativa Japonica Group]
ARIPPGCGPRAGCWPGPRPSRTRRRRAGRRPCTTAAHPAAPPHPILCGGARPATTPGPSKISSIPSQQIASFISDTSPSPTSSQSPFLYLPSPPLVSSRNLQLHPNKHASQDQEPQTI